MSNSVPKVSHHVPVTLTWASGPLHIRGLFLGYLPLSQPQGDCLTRVSGSKYSLGEAGHCPGVRVGIYSSQSARVNQGHVILFSLLFIL